jgi:hypothetical protein
MNEDYLWDKSGEADPEILGLEETLGRLRHKRPLQSLPLPTTRARPSYRPAFSPLLAIAATLVVLLLAGGLWLRFHRSSSSAESNAAAGTLPEATPGQQITSGPPPHVGPVEASGGEKDVERRLSKPSDPGSTRNAIHHLTVERRQEVAAMKTVSNQARLSRELIIHEGELAREQLIKALLITSDKLNTVQKKIQGSEGRGPVS